MTTSLEGVEGPARLEDEREILDTLYRYGHTLDYGLEQDWVDCFTEDAIWVTRRAPLAVGGAPEHRVQGHPELASLVAGFPGPPEAWHKHMLVQPRIEIDGDRCQVDSYFLVPAGHPTGPYILAFGRYRDRLVRCSDGRWRFEERIAEIDGTHPLREPLLGHDVSQGLEIEEIKRLKARYCHFLDAKRWPEWADLFTDDAQLRPAAREDEIVEGRAAILARVSALVAEVATVHEAATPDIEITGPTSARGTWGTFSITAAGSNGEGGPSEHRWGQHDEDYALGADGRWRIRSLTVRQLRVERR